MDTALKMVRNLIGNQALYKNPFKLEFRVKSIHIEICVVYGDEHISLSTIYR